jgi:pimeloyl-ACP methyl ester carboxylesterase
VEFRSIRGGDGQTFVASVAGEGPDVLLLHGFPDTPRSWAETESKLVGAGYRVTVPWLRGYHPDTIVEGRPYDPETIGHDALGLLDALGIAQTAIVGHDWGALMAYVTATVAPERVRGIVTLAIPHPSLLRRTPAALFRARHIPGLKLPWAETIVKRGNLAYIDKLYRRWAPNWSGVARDESIRQAKEALSTPATLTGAIAYYRDLPLAPGPLLAKLPDVPGLIVGGTADLIDPALFSATATRLPAPSRALVVDGAGHWPHRESAALVLPELQSFLAQLGAAG